MKTSFVILNYNPERGLEEITTFDTLQQAETFVDFESFANPSLRLKIIQTTTADKTMSDVTEAHVQKHKNDEIFKTIRDTIQSLD